ncbi:hypothetical protein C0Z18_16980 [Trinickia dabaoshanensis]|uniref:Uncharacterized protein n=1 Tax=Trinickia dabaoshanensis TaxID=564714 RepID=A0A2N7VMA8_9BURK|nr:hypothetical protein [Trinickia dabaoshanensis]PMS18280.1 hypothetical protein C0Z18_16980 [Trinickia dabaoshanensis]
MTQVQSSSQEFSEAATSLASAQRQILNDLNATIVQSLRDRQEEAYLMGKPFKLDAISQPIPQPIIDARVRAAQAIQAYGQALLNVASGSNETTVDSYTETLAKDVKKALPNVNMNKTGEAAAGVTGIANIALQWYEYKSITQIAQAAQPHIISIARLFADDSVIEEVSDQTAVMMDVGARELILAKIRDDERVPTDRRDEAFVKMSARSPFDRLSNEQANLNQLMATLVRCNAALAAGQQQTFSSLAHAAYLRGKDMYSVYLDVKSDK